MRRAPDKRWTGVFGERSRRTRASFGLLHGAARMAPGVGSPGAGTEEWDASALRAVPLPRPDGRRRRPPGGGKGRGRRGGTAHGGAPARPRPPATAPPGGRLRGARAADPAPALGPGSRSGTRRRPREGHTICRPPPPRPARSPPLAPERETARRRAPSPRVAPLGVRHRHRPGVRLRGARPRGPGGRVLGRRAVRGLRAPPPGHRTAPASPRRNTANRRPACPTGARSGNPGSAPMRAMPVGGHPVEEGPLGGGGGHRAPAPAGSHRPGMAGSRPSGKSSSQWTPVTGSGPWERSARPGGGGPRLGGRSRPEGLPSPGTLPLLAGLGHSPPPAAARPDRGGPAGRCRRTRRGRRHAPGGAAPPGRRTGRARRASGAGPGRSRRRRRRRRRRSPRLEGRAGGGRLRGGPPGPGQRQAPGRHR
ncbi:hypothetical protein EES47_26605 [Streptomyces sp. ADI98-12]|nr:hypothetical protein EES47_26605 [Streptomyces sp. ADI98-12]